MLKQHEKFHYTIVKLLNHFFADATQVFDYVNLSDFQVVKAVFQRVETHPRTPAPTRDWYRGVLFLL